MRDQESGESSWRGIRRGRAANCECDVRLQVLLMAATSVRFATMFAVASAGWLRVAAGTRYLSSRAGDEPLLYPSVPHRSRA